MKLIVKEAALDIYWKILRIFYWIGLIDTNERKTFRWSDFYRIKTH